MKAKRDKYVRGVGCCSYKKRCSKCKKMVYVKKGEIKKKSI